MRSGRFGRSRTGRRSKRASNSARTRRPGRRPQTPHKRPLKTRVRKIEREGGELGTQAPADHADADVFEIDRLVSRWGLSLRRWVRIGMPLRKRPRTSFANYQSPRSNSNEPAAARRCGRNARPTRTACYGLCFPPLPLRLLRGRAILVPMITGSRISIGANELKGSTPTILSPSFSLEKTKQLHLRASLSEYWVQRSRGSVGRSTP